MYRKQNVVGQTLCLGGVYVDGVGTIHKGEKRVGEGTIHRGVFDEGTMHGQTGL